MCKVCESNEKINSDWLDISIDGNTLKIEYDAFSCDSSFNEYLDINFCPVCGDKLSGETK